jgi:probable phosphoglycerate mutase
MVRILLVRHGQSEWNAEGRWQGQADIPLTDLGRAQARAATKRIGSFDMIAASPLLRASETAAIIAAAIGMGPVIAVPKLVERSAGEWSGLTRTDIHRDWPGYLEADKRPPGYENDADLGARLDEGLREVANMLGDGEALVVGHGGLIYLLEDRAGLRRGRIGNVGALWLDVADDGTIMVGDRVELLDDEDELKSAQTSDIL